MLFLSCVSEPVSFEAVFPAEGGNAKVTREGFFLRVSQYVPTESFTLFKCSWALVTGKWPFFRVATHMTGKTTALSELLGANVT